MIKIGDTVKVYVDPLTCKELEFTGTVKKMHRNYHDCDYNDALVFCKVFDSEYEQSFDRQININNH